MSFDDIVKLLKAEQKLLQEKEEKLGEALWFIQRLEDEDFDSYAERETLENDLKEILEELNIEY
tara:strand:- start:25 stop:216 length:192 start_codon:yes stop_codon:yes gene_type:complete